MPCPPHPKTPMTQPHTYLARRYDEQLVLKVPPLLLLVMVFLVRHVFLVLLSFLPRTGDAMTYLRDLVDPLFLLSDLPAALVLLAVLLRKAGSPAWLQTLWHKGQSLLTIAALLYIAILAVLLTRSVRPLVQSINEAIILSVLLHVAIIFYLVRSTLIRDVFADFPADAEKQ